MLFRSQMRRLKWIWAQGGEKPEGMLSRVWLDLTDMFIEFGPDDCCF